MSFGRPTKYKPEFCSMLVKHFAEGYSFESFGAIADCCFDTLHEWVKVYPDFSDAKKQGKPKSLYWWETVGRGGVTGKLKGFNTATWIFNMKNRHGWRDVQEIDATNMVPIIFKYTLDDTDVNTDPK